MWQHLADRAVDLALAILNLLAPVEADVQRDLVYAPGPGHRVDVYRPAGSGARPVVVFLYGGGWREGSKESVAFVGAALARRGFVAVIPEYRHFPAASLPEILDDNAAAVAWTLAHAGGFAGDPRRVVVAGHSSGAWAAAMLGLDRRWLERAGSGPDALAGIVGLAGPYAAAALTEEADREVFAGSGPDLQPINHLIGRHPSMLLLAGAADMDVRPDSTVALANGLRGDGAVATRLYPEQGHGEIVHAVSFPFSLRSAVADDIARFVDGARIRP